jgi:hypothetical protein
MPTATTSISVLLGVSAREASHTARETTPRWTDRQRVAEHGGEGERHGCESESSQHEQSEGDNQAGDLTGTSTRVAVTVAPEPETPEAVPWYLAPTRVPVDSLADWAGSHVAERDAERSGDEESPAQQGAW